MFDDPFFSDPFHNSIRSSLFDDPFFNTPGFPSMLDPFGDMMEMRQRSLRNHQPEQHQRRQQPQPSLRIEEVEEGETGQHHTSTRGARQPIIEEPEDEDHNRNTGSNSAQHPQHQSPQHQHQHQHQHSYGSSNNTRSAQNHRRHTVHDSMAPSYGGGGSGAHYVYSSFTSSTSSGNGNTYSYSSSTTSRGVNGVTETRHTERDSTGREKIAIKRGLADKAQIVERTRDASGHEETKKYLRNINQDDENRFDQQWRTAAERNMASTNRLMGLSDPYTTHSTPSTNTARLGIENVPQYHSSTRRY